MKKRYQNNYESLDFQQSDPAYLKTLESHVGTILSTLNALESAFRQSHPPLFPKIQNALSPFKEHLTISRESFARVGKTHNAMDLACQLDEVVVRTERALQYFFEQGDGEQMLQNWMKSMRQHCRALETLYPLHRILKPVNRYFLESGVRKQQEGFIVPDKDNTGLFDNRDPETHSGGYTCFIPETYDGKSNWPMVIALHGGYGTGRDFIWYWLREARSRKFLLAAPNSTGSTWSFDNETDQIAINEMVTKLSLRYRIDPKRILLTGFSDGAIYSLILGLQENSPFIALAPISGVLHPVNLQTAPQKRIYMTHGSWDWMFSIEKARQAADILRKAGANMTFKEIEQLSHTYPREQNRFILDWFDVSLSLS